MDAIGSWAWLASVTAFALAVTATPGPNNVMLTASGASWGFRRTVPHILGIAVGFPLMLVAVAFGAGEVLRASSRLQEALRWVGAAYLLWLAVQIALAEPPQAGVPTRGRPLGFTRAALFQWVNPKAWVISLSAIVTYAAPGSSAFWVAAIFASITVPCCALWTALGVGAARLLRTRRLLRGFNLAMAALLVASLASLLSGG